MRIHDGAYGTLLAPHLRGGETVDDLCTRDPRVVVDAHRAYLEAGATAIQTNAFLAFARRSDRRRRELHRAAIECAREAIATALPPQSEAAERAAAPSLFATLGPAGEAPRDFWLDLETVLDAGAPGVLCETVTTLPIAEAFLAAWHEVAAGVTDVEVLLGCSISPSRGTDACAWVERLAQDAGEHVRIGFNCCEGPEGLRDHLARLCEIRGTAWVVPSAGVPTSATEAIPITAAPINTGAWATAVVELVDGLPVTGVGGCCGTTPDATAHLASELARAQ